MGAERHVARKATDDEVKARMAEFGDDADTARAAVQAEIDSRVGTLTEKGAATAQLMTEVTKGFIEGGTSATLALQSVAASLGVKPEGSLALVEGKLADKKLSDAERAHWQGMRDMIVNLEAARKSEGVIGFAKDKGVAVGMNISETDVQAALELSESDLKVTPDAGLKGKAAADAKAASDQAVAAQQAFLDASKSMTEQMLLNDADIEQLGAGGLGLVTGQFDAEGKIADLAAKAGVSAAELLAGRGPAELVAEARKLRAGLVDNWEKIRDIKRVGLMPEGAGRPPMSAHERDVHSRVRDFITGKAIADKMKPGANIKDVQASEATSRLLAHVSTDSTAASAEGRKQLLSEISKGDRAVAVVQAMAARDELVEMASTQGVVRMTPDGLAFGAGKDGRALTAHELSSLSGEERQKAINALRAADKDEDTQRVFDSLQPQMGPFGGVGGSKVGIAELMSQVKQLSASERESLGGGAGGDKVAMTLDGVVEVINPEMLAIRGSLDGGPEHNDVATSLVSPTSGTVAPSGLGYT